MDFQVDKIPIIHEDERRKLTAIFNGEFIAKQIKIIEVKEGSFLGNHYHPYAELFYILKGRAMFLLTDIHTNEQEIIPLLEGSRLIIGKDIMHVVAMIRGVVSIEATAEPYISSEKSDLK